MPITGGGFFNIDVGSLHDGGHPGEVFAAIIKFPVAPLSEEQLSDELKHLVDELWTGRSVDSRTLNSQLVSPRVRLCALARARISCSYHSIRLTPPSGRLSSPLGLLWCYSQAGLTGVREDLMTKERLRAAMVMIVRKLDVDERKLHVDELSIQKRDRKHVRMRFQCRFPQRIKGSI
jgi:hypothetical protein